MPPTPWMGYAARPMADDTALLERLRSGESAAFEELVRSYGGEMRAVALRILMDEADADDAVQDAFLSAFRALKSFEGRSELGTWLHRIVINTSLMKLRAKGRSKETDLGGLLPDFVESGVFAEAQPPWQESADEPAIRKELLEQVHSVIEKLPDTYRVPLLLRDIEGLSNQEVAEALGVTGNAVRVRVHRARQALGSLLKPHIAGLL